LSGTRQNLSAIDEPTTALVILLRSGRRHIVHDMADAADSIPDVSVVIPTYNRAVLVARCVASLRAMGGADVDIIVVDDGGTDDTERVVREAGATYVRQPNAGPAAARNTGFEASRGRYVAFIDSDDEWLPGIGRLVRQIASNPDVDVIFADTAMGNDADGYVSFVQVYGGDRFLALPDQRRADGVRVLDRRSFFLQLSTRNVMFLGSMLIRREFFTRVGGFDPALRGAADWDFFMRATAAGAIAYSDGDPVSRYYKHDEGMSTDTDHMEEDFIKALESVRRRAPLDAVELAHVKARLRDHTFGWAWLAYERGDLRTMRRRLAWARTLGAFGIREMAYAAVTYLPPRLVSALRRARRRAVATA
jgi:glycosyltransferase involved in cell wall biosynthesis